MRFANVVAVLEQDGIFPLKEEQRKVLGGKVFSVDNMFSLYYHLALASILQEQKHIAASQEVLTCSSHRPHTNSEP